MSKKDFIALADGLRAEKPMFEFEPKMMTQWKLDVMAIANVLANDNPRFNRSRWMDYVNGLCGLNGGKL